MATEGLFFGNLMQGYLLAKATSRERKLIRTTLYVVSPALAPPEQTRSRLYSVSHRHLFRGGAPEDEAPVRSVSAGMAPPAEQQAD